MTDSGGARGLGPRILTAVVATAVAVGAGGIFWALYGPRDRVNLDLTMVEADRSALPFFDVVFDYEPLGDDWNFADPYLRRRGMPLLEESRARRLGPHDVLGFRNLAVPTRPDVVVIGDSQAYGLNAQVEDTWPSLLEAASGLSVYNMSMAGWGGLSYLYMTPKALAFRPKLVVVALYMGNDSIENVLMAYGGSYWQEYRPSPELDLEQIRMEIRVGEREEIKVGPGQELPFQTAYRLDVNDPGSLAVELGYEIQNRAVEEIIALCREAETPLAFVILPTKESLYGPHLRSSGVETSDEYRLLLEAEASHARRLEETIERSGSVHIDVIGPLREEISRGEQLYPRSGDGHPSTRGYQALAEAIHAGLRSRFPDLVD